MTIFLRWVKQEEGELWGMKAQSLVLDTFSLGYS